MTRSRGQGPPEDDADREPPAADRKRGVMRLRTEDVTSWWEQELRRLGADILAEPVPDRLRAICTNARSETDARDGRQAASDRPEDDTG
ncbi:MAG: hypothetical protein R3F54_16750 [Alphaproteobacteria bacterium]